MATMKVPDNCGGVSFNGVEYTPDDNGVIDVPAEAVNELKNHGCIVVTEFKAGKKGKKE